MKELGIYIHIPFCVKKCQYCDFLSIPAGKACGDKLILAQQYVGRLTEEIRSYADWAREGKWRAKTLFVGGGTPSLLPGKWMEEIFEAVQTAFCWEKQPEITIECNPESATQAKLSLYKMLGANRISLGLQSCDNEELARIGRSHDYETFLRAYEAARKAGFDNINVDLMAALPGQTCRSYENTLRKVLMLKPEHISAYSLILEEGTPLKEAGDKGLYHFPDEEEERKMYHRTGEMLARAGYHRYEVSNYAREGRACLHNLIYWSEGNYLGLGLGASSYLDGVRFKNPDSFEEYLKKTDIPPEERVERREAQVLTLEEQMEEFMFLGLRKINGVSMAEFEERYGRPMEEVYGQVMARSKERGLLEQQGDRVFLTPLGLDVSNYVLADFLLV